MSVSGPQPSSPKGFSSEPTQQADPAEVQKVKRFIEELFKQIPEKPKEVEALQQHLISDLEGNVTVETVNKVNDLARIILFTKNIDELFQKHSLLDSIDPRYLNTVLWMAIKQENEIGKIVRKTVKHRIKNQKILIEIAKIAATRNGEGVSYYIQAARITDQEALIEIAKIAAAHSGREVSHYIQNYGITNQEALIEIAKIATTQSGRGVSKHIQNYGITDQEALIEIAKIAAAQDGEGISYYIQNYGITNQEALIEIAKIAAAQNGRGVSKHIQNYGITNQEALIEIAKIAAAQDGEWVSYYIQNYGITDQEALIGIAKIAAVQDGEGVSKNIQNYGITDQEALIEIAKIAAVQDGEGVSKNIQNYGIRNEESLIETAKIAAAQDGEGVSKNIQNYGIRNEESLIETAKIAAAQNGEGVSKNIQNYGVTDQEALIEIAKIAAAQDGIGVSCHIQKYRITNEEALIEIAKKVMVQNGEGVSYYIRNYRITNKEALIEIAKIAAAQSGRGVAECILDYGITNQEVLIGIAKIIATQDGRGVSECIRNYRISNEEALIEIAKIVATQDGRGVSECIQNYKISNEEALIEIAKIAAAQNGEGVSRYIKNYGITNQKALIEIAKIAAAQNGEGVSRYIKNYGITNEEALIGIAKIAAAQNGERVSKNIQNYGITNQKALIEIAKIAVAQNGEGVSHYIQNYGITNEKDLIEIATIYIRGTRFLEDYEFPRFFPNGVKECLEDYESLVFLNFSYLASQTPDFVFKDLSGDEPNGITFHLRVLIKEDGTLSPKREFLKEQRTFFLCIQCAEEVLRSLRPDFPSKALLEQIKKYRNPSIACLLLGEFISDVKSPEYQEAYLQLARHVTDHLLSIIPAKWMKEAGIKEAPDELLQFFKNCKKILKDKNKPLLQRYFMTVLQLNALDGISSQRKLELLTAICNQEEKDVTLVLKGLSYLSALTQRKAIKKLNELPLQEAPQEFEEAFKDLLSSDPDIRISDIEDFAGLYLKTFGETRIPLALDIYKAQISSLKNPQLMSELERFVRSVLLGTFSKERFRTDISPHLKKIEETSNEIFIGWKNVTYSKEVSVEPLDQKEKQFSFADFFEEKLHDKHWEKNGEDCLPQLTQYVQKTSAAEPSEEIPVLCKRLIEEISLSKEEQLSILRQLIRKLEEDPSTHELELKNDLNGLMGSLSSFKAPTGDEKVILSRDWQDLLLCGTEVSGSCQRIDGDPSFTKGLIAYIMDGKNALVAVKNKEGKILARSLLRLLWNEKEQKPALFLDRLYPSSCSTERKKAIIEASIECAKSLGLDLFTQWAGHESASDISLESLQGPCPYEYVDAAGGINRNGIFTIQNLWKVELAV